VALFHKSMSMITIALNKKENDYSNVFKKELDSRYEEYKKDGKLVSEADANKRIHKIITVKNATISRKRNGGFRI